LSKDIAINQIQIPEGLTEDDVKQLLPFEREIHSLFCQFVREKQEGMHSEVDTYERLDKWIRTRLREKGYITKEAGTTDATGKVAIKRKEHPRPDEKYEEQLTEFVHEPSHVVGNQHRAAQAGIVLEKYVKYVEVVKQIRRFSDKRESADDILTSLTSEEQAILRWALQTQSKIADYHKLLNNTIDLAEEEAKEYQAEINVKEQTLDYFERI